MTSSAAPLSGKASGVATTRIGVGIKVGSGSDGCREGCGEGSDDG
jgi:hypothetical protein